MQPVSQLWRSVPANLRNFEPCPRAGGLSTPYAIVCGGRRWKWTTRIFVSPEAPRVSSASAGATEAPPPSSLTLSVLALSRSKNRKTPLLPSPLSANDRPFIEEHKSTKAEARKRAEQGQKRVQREQKARFRAIFPHFYALFGLFRPLPRFFMARK